MLLKTEKTKENCKSERPPPKKFAGGTCWRGWPPAPPGVGRYRWSWGGPQKFSQHSVFLVSGAQGTGAQNRRGGAQLVRATANALLHQDVCIRRHSRSVTAGPTGRTVAAVRLLLPAALLRLAAQHCCSSLISQPGNPRSGRFFPKAVAGHHLAPFSVVR